MARRSAKRIVLDELTRLYCEELRAFDEVADCGNSVEITFAKQIKARAHKLVNMANEALKIAQMLGATPDEIKKATDDGETLYESQK